MKKNFVKNWLIPIAIGFPIGIGFVYFDLFNKFSLSSINGIALLFAVLTFPIAIIIHECGHYLAGKFINFNFHALMVYKYGVVNEAGILQFKKYARSFGGGLTIMSPKAKQEPSRSELFLYFFGGALINLLCVLVCFLIISKELVKPGLTKDLIYGFGLISLFTALIALIPVTIGGMMTDGSRILSILRSKEEALFNTNMMSLFGMAISGPRPSEWPTSLLLKQNIKLPFLLECVQTILNYYHEFDSNKLEKAKASITDTMNILNQLEYEKTLMLGDYFKEVAFYKLIIERDVIAATQWRSKAIDTVISAPYFDDLLDACECQLNQKHQLALEKIELAKSKTKNSITPFIANIQIEWAKTHLDF